MVSVILELEPAGMRRPALGVRFPRWNAFEAIDPIRSPTTATLGPATIGTSPHGRHRRFDRRPVFREEETAEDNVDQHLAKSIVVVVSPRVVVSSVARRAKGDRCDNKPE